MVCGLLVPQPGIKPMPAALAAWSLNLWTSREVVPVPIFRNALLCLGLMWMNPATAPSQRAWREAS